MTRFSSELSGSLILNSGSVTLELQPYSGGLNVSGSDLYINQVSLDSRISSIESGNAGTASLLPLNQHSASANLRLGVLESSSAAVNTETGSILTSIGNLTAVTGSYIVTSSGFISSSEQISQSGYLTSASAASLGFGSGGGGSTPAGTISSSAQIDALGYITSSVSSSFASTASFISDTFISASAARGGFGSGGSTPAGTISGSTQIEELGFITSSNINTASFVQNSATSSFVTNSQTSSFVLNSATSSFIVSSQTSSFVTSDQTSSFGAASTGSLVQTASVSSNTITFTKGDNTTFDITVATGSGGGGGDVTYDGNRQVSQDLFPTMFSGSFNPGTSGSIQDFLNAVFYPNSAPSITTGNQTIVEFTASGSAIVTVTGTDPEGQSLTFGTSSAYTDDFVRVSGSGEMTLNTLATGSMNTVDRGDGTDAHPIILRVVDSFGTAATKTIYLTVTLNSAPQFRETSVSGNVITSYSTSRNENAAAGEVTRIYFTDVDSDAITITSQSDANNHFIFTKTGSYVRLLQNTASLDYETTSSYSLSITASDEHSVAGVDGNSFTTIPVTVNVTDNVPPTFNNQTITGVTESVAAGTSAGAATATDDEGDTITFVSFTLAGLKLDGGDVTTGSYSGTGKNDPTEDAFQMASNGAVTTKVGAYLNSDIINAYIYSASASDPYNTSTNATVTIPVVDDQAPTISGNTTLYVIESATTGNGVKTNTDGLSGTNARFTADQAVTWSISSSGWFSIDSSGYVTLSSDISGSAYVGGTQLNGSVTASNSFGTPSQTNFTVNITDNAAPTITFTDTTANLNTNGARSGSTITTISFADVESDSVDLASFTFTDPSGQLNAVQAGSTFLIQATNNLSASTYGFTSSIADVNGFETRTSTSDVTIAAAPLGTASNNGTYYIIESAISGSNIVTNANGRTGTQGDIDVSYSPQYNSAAVQSFTSSNAAVVIDGNGSLTLGVDISGSATSSGDTIASTITYRDQYDNIGSSSISVNVAVNSSPTASFSNSGYTGNYNTNLATSGTTLLSSTITDVESETPYSASLSGTNASSFTLVPQNANSSSYLINTSEDLAAGTYYYSMSVVDSFNKQSNYNRSLTIASADIGTLSTNGTFYIIESAVSGGLVRINSDGRTGTQGDLGVSYSPSYGSPTVQSFTSSNSQVAVTSAGALTVAFNVSGSGTGSGDTITSDITFRDQYNNIGSGSITVNVATNNAPDISFSDTSANHNTNLGRSGSTLVTLTFSDTEGDTINYSGVAFENTGSQLNLIQDGTSWLVQAKENLSASAYSYTASVQDNHQFRTNTETDSFTIAAADIGTMSTNGTFYIIESAVSGSDVVTNSNGRTGTQGNVSASYSPNYGTAVVQSFTSSNSAVAVDSSGNLSLALNLSGSSTGSGDTITSDITFRDQYDNIGSGSITVNVTENAAPTVVSFSDITANLTASIATGTDLVSMSIADTESNTPYSASLSGTDASKLTFQWLNADSSSAFIEAATTIEAGSYTYDVKVTDNFNKSTTYSGRTLTVAGAPSLYYVYMDEAGVYASAESNALTMYGDTSDNGTVDAGSTFAAFAGGSLGDTTINTTIWQSSLGIEKVFLIGSGSLLSGSNASSLIDGVDHTTGSQGGTGMHIVFPSGSSTFTNPGSFTNSLGGSSAGEYLLYADRVGTGIVDAVQSAYVRYFQFTGGNTYPGSGEAGFGVIFTQNDSTADINYFLMASSGSAPSSTQ